MSQKPLITIDNISVRRQQEVILHEVSWQVNTGEQWVIIGRNGSGKSTLVQALWGRLDTIAGKIKLHFDEENHHPAYYKDQIGYVAFELHQRMMEKEDFNDVMREYAGSENKITTCRDLVTSAIKEIDEDLLKQITKKMGITHLLDRNMKVLSTGEMRKALICRALVKQPKLLILDEPFDGLDVASRDHLRDSINELMSSDLNVILITHRLEEIVPSITHVLMMKEGKILKNGAKSELLTADSMSELYDCPMEVDFKNDYYHLSFGITQHPPINFRNLFDRFTNFSPNNLIQMKDVTVKYGEKLALDHLNWVMKKGENWTILGHNGSGKSTIVKLITGENVQGYANQVFLFDKKKGSGESIWDIKKYLGVVSGEVQIQYRKNMPTFDVICSGFYDSIGLYKQPTAEQEKVARQWIDILGIEDLMQWNFHNLSYGQKRMVLLARAMLKPPLLLIIDEPCHGLDIPNRRRILNLIETIGETPTNLLYITHHEEEILPCMTHVLHLDEGRVVSQGERR